MDLTKIRNIDRNRLDERSPSTRNPHIQLNTNFVFAFPSITNKQVEILLRELCRLHNVPLPSELDSLMLPQPIPGDFLSNYSNLNQEQQAIDDSDPDDIEDGVGESEPESEVDEDLPLEMDDSRNSNKVNERIGFSFFLGFSRFVRM